MSAMVKRLDETSKTVRIQVVATDAWLARVEEWRRRQMVIPNRSNAIRQLVEAGLGTTPAAKPKRRG